MGTRAGAKTNRGWEMREDILELITKIRSGSFSKTGYSVNIQLRERSRFIKGIELYSDWESHELKRDNSVEYFFDKITPQFQRSNDKWSMEMKIKFVENLLKGCPTEIKLFRVGDTSTMQDAQIIDGLQRLTAIFDFMCSDFEVFGKSYSYLCDDLNNFPVRLLLSVYDFENFEQVGRYYIDMNENITHSSDDIQKAKDWFLVNHGIKL